MEIRQYTENNIKFIRVINNNGLEVTLTDLGASIYSILFDGKIMTLTPKDSEVYKKGNVYWGKTIGPIANRIAEGKVTIKGKNYQFEKNENGNCLHSGKDGLSNKYFTFAIKNTAKTAQVTFKFTNRSGESPLPGKINYIVNYVFSEDNTFKVTFKVNSNHENIIALTNHAYFCMGSDSDLNLNLTINASKYILPKPNDLLPIKETYVEDILDFRKGRILGKEIKNEAIYAGKTHGYDHSFVLDNNEHPISLESNDYRMEINTDFPCVQIYSDNWEDTIETIGSKNFVYRAVAIEPQDNFFSRPVIKPFFKNYKRTITYTFLKK